MRQLSLWLMVALCVVAVGCLDRTVGPLPPTPSPAPTPLPQPSPQPTPDGRSHTDAEFWAALAARVSAGKIDSTDEILAIVKAGRAAGDVTNALKLGEALPNAAAANEPINDTNRTRIAAAIAALK